jgi:hypothetical protein
VSVIFDNPTDEPYSFIKENGSVKVETSKIFVDVLITPVLSKNMPNEGFAYNFLYLNFLGGSFWSWITQSVMKKFILAIADSDL